MTRDPTLLCRRDVPPAAPHATLPQSHLHAPERLKNTSSGPRRWESTPSCLSSSASRGLVFGRPARDVGSGGSTSRPSGQGRCSARGTDGWGTREEERRDGEGCVCLPPRRECSSVRWGRDAGLLFFLSFFPVLFLFFCCCFHIALRETGVKS